MKQRRVSVCRGLSCSEKDPEGTILQALKADSGLAGIDFNEIHSCQSHCAIGPNALVDPVKGLATSHNSKNPDPRMAVGLTSTNAPTKVRYVLLDLLK